MANWLSTWKVSVAGGKFKLGLSVFVLITFCCVYTDSKPANSEEDGSNENVANMQVADNAIPADNTIPADNDIAQEAQQVPVAAEDKVGQGNSQGEQVVLEQRDSSSHDHQADENADCPLCKESEAKEQQEAEQKRLADIKKFEEEVQRNVHDARSRAIADQMKNKPFEAGNIEEMMHGGHHVHGENGDKKAKPAGIDLSDILGQPDPEPKKDTRDPGTLDPDEMLHFGGESHDHGDPHGDKPAEVVKDPMADSPDDTLPRAERRQVFGPMMEGMNADGASESYGETGSKTIEDVDDQNTQVQDIGVSIERIVHGEDHVHDHKAESQDDETDEGGNVKRRKITFRDIMNLGLSQEDLKGIDIKKLLTDNEEEYQLWQKENNKEPSQMSFWDQLNELRRQYFGSSAKKVKDVSKVNAEDVEWERTGEEEEDGVHEGESDLEHEMEMWGSTLGKKNRRPYKQLRGEDL